MEPFRIDIPADFLDDLERRLRATRFAITATESAWEAGTPPEYLAEVVGYWLDGR